MTAGPPADPAPDRKAVRARIVGRVQGVWYRGWAVETATGLGLGGWVRNRADGTVEALFAGPADAVDRMLAACRRGPGAAVVREVVVEPVTDPDREAGGAGFEQRPTL